MYSTRAASLYVLNIDLLAIAELKVVDDLAESLDALPALLGEKRGRHLACPGPDFSGQEFGVKSCLKKEP